MFRFEKLDIWNDAITFANNIYLLTKKFPRSEMFALTDQLRRSSTSISANIAEGSASSSDKDFANYLQISIKSTYETVSHLRIASEQKYITSSEIEMLYSDAELLSKRIRSFRNILLNKKISLP